MTSPIHIPIFELMCPFLFILIIIPAAKAYLFHSEHEKYNSQKLFLSSH